MGAHFGLALPDPGDVTDLEVSSRFHIEDNGEIYLHSNFLLDKEGNSRSVPVAFILHQGILFSLRNEELPVFRLQRRLARTQPGYVSDSTDVLLDLYGADVEYSADSLEDIYATLGKVGTPGAEETISDEEAAAILGGHRRGRRPERAHPGQHPGHPARHQLPDAQQDPVCRRSRTMRNRSRATSNP